MSSFRVLYRIVGIIRIAIIARILSPHDFGLFGITLITLAFLEIITETGINIFLIQEEKIDKYINTAWVLSIVRGIIISFLIFIFSGVIANFFNSDESINLLRLIAIVPIIKGFINPSIVKFQQELKFGKEFLYRTSYYLIESIASIILCSWLRSPTALVIGLLIGAIYELFYTHLVINPRPKFEFNLILAKDILKRGKWITAFGVSDFIYTQADNIVVGKLLGLTSLGIYQNAYKISTAPLTEIGDVFFRVSFPIFSKIGGDRERLRKAFIKNTIASATLMILFGTAVFLLATPVVNIIFGYGWESAIPVVKLLSILGVIRGILSSTNSLLVSLKLQKYSAIVTFSSVCGLLITIVPFVRIYGIIGAGIAAIIGILVSLPFTFYYVNKAFKHT